ncbi:MAG: class II aldolase/adducin family protein [Myxococcota bacterium]
MESVGDGPRVKYALRRLGAPELPHTALREALAAALRSLEEAGCCPVLDDGLAAGNGAVCTPDGALLVSPSGRPPGHFAPDDLVELVAFDAERWAATYRSHDPALRPTSDAALHWAALIEAPRALGWAEAPGASLHGHVLQTTRAAEVLGLPLSVEATLFSTPADRQALLELLARAPYPAHRTVIRRDHGFFTLGPDLPGTTAAVRELATRARAHALLPAIR